MVFFNIINPLSLFMKENLAKGKSLIDHCNLGVSIELGSHTSKKSIELFLDVLKHFVSETDSVAVGVRVLINGCWGFAGTTDLTKYSLDKMLNRAIDNARIGSKFRKEKVIFKPQKPTIASYFFKPAEDPFLMDENEKIEFHQKIAKKLVGNKKIIESIIKYLHHSFFTPLTNHPHYFFYDLV